MLKHVHFKNFRGFARFDAGVGPVTAFLGPNSSGKTTILHAVRLACEAIRVALDSDATASIVDEDGKKWVRVANELLVSDYTRLLAVSDWRALFLDQEVGEGVVSRVILTFDDTDPIRSVWVEILCARNEQLKLDVYLLAPDAVVAVAGLPKKSSSVSQKLREFVAQHAPRAVLVPPFYGVVSSEEYRSRIVVDGLLGSGDQSHVVRNLIAALESDQLDRLNSFLSDTVGARLTYRTSGDKLQTESPLRVTFRDSNGDLELSAAGAGVVNLIALHAALSRWRPESRNRRILFLLDEPEAHLHPRLQAESTERLGRLANEFNAQLLLATHSVDILNRLSESGALLLRCDRTADPSAVALDSDSKLFDDLAEWAELTPYTAINFLASRRVAFCEGEDEVALLPRLAELKYRNDPRRLEAFRRWALVELEGVGNHPIADLLRRLLANDVVRARAKDSKFSVLVVLDRDYARAPGVSATKQGLIDYAEIVWTRHSLESLFLDERILTTWVRAFLGQACPADIADRVKTAIALANSSQALTDRALASLSYAIEKAGLSDPDGKPLSGERLHHRALDEARRAIQGASETWHRGKDRALFVLRTVRESLPVPMKNRFPTDVIQLVKKANLLEIGVIEQAIPKEVSDLLDRMANA